MLYYNQNSPNPTHIHIERVKNSGVFEKMTNKEIYDYFEKIREYYK